MHDNSDLIFFSHLKTIRSMTEKKHVYVAKLNLQ